MLVLGLVVLVVALYTVHRGRARVYRMVPISARTAKTKPMPSEWNWQNVGTEGALVWQRYFGRAIAPGTYTSPIFDQHMSKWCGCCYLVSVVQMIQDRMHVALGIAQPSLSMFPCFQFNMQMALDTYNAYEARHRSDWNACSGGMPLRVIEAIRANQCILRLMADLTVWMGHPCEIDEQLNGDDDNIQLELGDALQNSVEYIRYRIFKYGPVVLGIDSLCLRDPELGRRYGVVDIRQSSLRDHAVSVVGWTQKNGKSCWIVRNSWGTERVPSERPSNVACVGANFNHCTVSTTQWTGDPNNLGYAYVPTDYSGLRGVPSPWFDSVPSSLRDLLPKDVYEVEHDIPPFATSLPQRYPIRG